MIPHRAHLFDVLCEAFYSLMQHCYTILGLLATQCVVSLSFTLAAISRDAFSTMFVLEPMGQTIEFICYSMLSYLGCMPLISNVATPETVG